MDDKDHSMTEYKNYFTQKKSGNTEPLGLHTNQDVPFPVSSEKRRVLGDRGVPSHRRARLSISSPACPRTWRHDLA